MTTPHLDDEQLSTLLDEEGADAHVRECAACGERFRRLTGARDAMAVAVAPLPPHVLDRMVAAALASAGDGGRERAAEGDADEAVPVAPTPIALASRRRLRVPPPGWLVGAAAAIALLAGVAGLVQRTGADRGATEGLAADTATPQAESPQSGAATAGEATAGVVGAALPDLGDVDDPAALVAILRTTAPTGGDAFGAADGGRAGEPPAVAAAPTTTTAPAAEAAPKAVTGPGAASAPARPSDEGGAVHPGVLCRSEADRIGAGRFGSHVATALVRWKGAPAEVLVFVLTEPANGVTRQALVLARPGCVLLADPRF